MNKKVLFFLPYADNMKFGDIENPDFEKVQLISTDMLKEMGKVYNYKEIPSIDVKEFIQKQIEECRPNYVVAEGNSASALMEVKFPNSILINPKVNADLLKEVPKEARANSYGYFDKNFEKDYELFQSVYPNSAWFQADKISILSLKSMIETIINEDEEW